jgi:DNA-binding response OmpR family regulator
MESVEKNPGGQKAQKRPNILVIEDSQSSYYRIARALKDEFEVFIATCGEEVFSMIGEQNFSAFIVDLALEHDEPVDAIPLIKEIRGRFPKVPILVLTKYQAEQFKERALEAGANDFLNKYQEFNLLHDRLTALMRVKS